MLDKLNFWGSGISYKPIPTTNHNIRKRRWCIKRLLLLHGLLAV